MGPTSVQAPPNVFLRGLATIGMEQGLLPDGTTFDQLRSVVAAVQSAGGGCLQGFRLSLVLPMCRRWVPAKKMRLYTLNASKLLLLLLLLLFAVVCYLLLLVLC
ncbi:unnamed protein product [Polarella glacialis]|uniref:Uncharacterized protein n=1 Tax=Polarella glacialis TaxID=89957 RepID=A0A813FQ58_POLGL|nr:unnamed protein product [Polarella glacialis]CAE8644689.1 unnamed protein product [Polarella glacialis]